MRIRTTSIVRPLAAGNHALAVRSREPRAHKVAITKRASAASSARASMARGDTCSGKAFVSQCATETPCGDTSRRKVLRYQQTARSVLNRGGKALSRGRDPAQLLIQRSTASGVRPSVECFPKNRCERAASGISAGTKKFFCKSVFHTKAIPLIGTEPFLDKFLSEGA